MTLIPSVEECFKLMEKYNMPDNIRAHSIIVRDVAVYLGKELNKKDENLDIILIESSALLHDIAKIHCIVPTKNFKTEGCKPTKRHDIEGGKILRSLGYERVAEIVEQHCNLFKKTKYLREEEIVQYADKRVMHEEIVSLKVRFDDIRARYGKNNPKGLENIYKSELEGREIEEKIFKKLDFSPEDLERLLK